MKNHTKFLILGFTLAIIPMANGSPESEATAQKFYSRFGSSDSITDREVIYDFNKEVPSSMRADALADLIEMQKRNENAERQGFALGEILVYLSYLPTGKNLPWNKRLQDAVLALKDSPLPNVRHAVLSTLSLIAAENAADKLPDALKPPGVFYRFLSDEDEEVRVVALGKISELPTGEKDLQAYIDANKTSDKRTRSVYVAQELLKRTLR